MHPVPPVLPTFLAVYSLLYAAFGVQSPFLPALLHEQGLRAEEIGIVLAASTSIRVFAGPAAMLAPIVALSDALATTAA